MAADPDSKSSSSMGSILGGLAAVIAAVATLIGVLHRDPAPKPSQDSVLQAPAPNQTAPMLPTETPRPKTTRAPVLSGASRPPAMKAAVQDAAPAEAANLPAEAPFDIEGVWSGRIEDEPTGFEINLAVDSAPDTNGKFGAMGSVSKKCPGTLEKRSIDSGSWKPLSTVEKNMYLFAYDSSRKSYWEFQLNRKGSRLKGTVGTLLTSGPKAGTIQRYPIELRKEKLACPGM